MINIFSTKAVAPIMLAIGLLITTSASALTIVSQVGGDGTDGTNPGANPVNSLTGGFINAGSVTWTHNYSIIGNITSATLEIDLIDADGGLLRLTSSGNLIDEFDPPSPVQDAGGPGPWRLITDEFDPSFVTNIASSFFADIADGSFTISGQNVGLFIFGINRAILTINTDAVAATVPVPAALPLFGTGLAIMGFVGWRRKRKATA